MVTFQTRFLLHLKDSFEIMAWGATITFLSIEIFIVNKVYFKKVFDGLKNI